LINQQRGFPGLFGSLDVTHFTWKNCPKSLHGQFLNKDGLFSIAAEVVATSDCFIWHLHSNMPGTLNDINILNRSPLVANILEKMTPAANFKINGRDYHQVYFLTDGIYPTWSCFAKPISMPLEAKKQQYTKCQEAIRKDVERTFGILKGKFHILSVPLRFWDRVEIDNVVRCCVIIHNIIRVDVVDHLLEEEDEIHIDPPRKAFAFPEFLNAVSTLQDEARHFQLQSDLVDHLWSLKGNNNE
jgi:hypothetical protein